MKTQKVESNKAANDSELADDKSVEDSVKKGSGRRLQDGILSKDPNRKLNLDRRTARNDRRCDSDPHYSGQSRRYTIDRRKNTKDRRGDD